MKRVLGAIGLLTALGVPGSLWWTRRQQLPCPSWLSGILEVPYFNFVAGSQRLLDRAGVRSGMRVLDAGCGPERVTIPAAERGGPGASATALDLQPGMLAQMVTRVETRGLENVQPLQAGLGEGRLPADTFDRAFLVTVLGEISDPVAALREIYTSLEPGGVLSLERCCPTHTTRHRERCAGMRRLRGSGCSRCTATSRPIRSIWSSRRDDSGFASTVLSPKALPRVPAGCKPGEGKLFQIFRAR